MLRFRRTGSLGARQLSLRLSYPLQRSLLRREEDLTRKKLVSFYLLYLKYRLYFFRNENSSKITIDSGGFHSRRCEIVVRPRLLANIREK